MVALKVSDLINFSEKDYLETQKTLTIMDDMVREYVNNTNDLDQLEILKRKFNGYQVYLATYYSKIKCYMENYQYLDSQRKRLKAEAIEHMMKSSEEKLTFSRAEAMVYNYPYYIERIKLIEKLKIFFHKVDMAYNNYNNVQRSIYQSISILSKERESTIS